MSSEIPDEGDAVDVNEDTDIVEDEDEETDAGAGVDGIEEDWND
jgi:hypothetical protein